MSGSYLGHGAKYWADRYFESQHQTRMPDDFSAIEWRDKYLSLEKSCNLYEAKIADLRVEVEDLRQKSSLQPEAVFFHGQTVEYWFNKYLQVSKRLEQKDSETIDARKLSSELEQSRTAYQKVTDDLRKKNQQYESALSEIEDLKRRLLAASFKDHDAKYWYDKSEAHRAAANNLSSALQKTQVSTACNGHDANYWYQLSCQQSLDLENLQHENNSLHQQNYTVHQKRNFYLSPRLLFIVLALAVLVFSVGLLLGEGYFAPQYTPSSPFISEVRQSEHDAGYDEGYYRGSRAGYRQGNREGYNDGYNTGKKNGYKQGYSDHAKGLASAYSGQD